MRPGGQVRAPLNDAPQLAAQYSFIWSRWTLNVSPSYWFPNFSPHGKTLRLIHAGYDSSICLILESASCFTLAADTPHPHPQGCRKTHNCCWTYRVCHQKGFDTLESVIQHGKQKPVTHKRSRDARQMFGDVSETKWKLLAVICTVKLQLSEISICFIPQSHEPSQGLTLTRGCFGGSWRGVAAS